MSFTESDYTFIRRVTRIVCRKSGYQNDPDEFLGIAWQAFDEAQHRWDPSRTPNFRSYAGPIIGNRIRDEMRRLAPHTRRTIEAVKKIDCEISQGKSPATAYETVVACHSSRFRGVVASILSRSSSAFALEQPATAGDSVWAPLQWEQLCKTIDNCAADGILTEAERSVMINMFIEDDTWTFPGKASKRAKCLREVGLSGLFKVKSYLLQTGDV